MNLFLEFFILYQLYLILNIITKKALSKNLNLISIISKLIKIKKFSMLI